MSAPASTTRPATLTITPELRYTQRGIGRESSKSIVPRSTSAATAADPLPIAQIEISKKMKGWLHEAMISEIESGSSVMPIILNI